MKIAISTNDKIHISDHFFASKYFKITIVEDSNIINEEFRDNIFIESEDIDQICSIINDCDIIITRKIEDDIKSYLFEKDCTIINTNEKIITLAITRFVNEIKRTRSNYCCEP